MSVPPEKKKIENILFVAITRMGDMLQASPTIAGLKREHPGARLTVAIDKQFASICAGIPGIDEVYVLDMTYLVQCMQIEGEGLVQAYGYLTEVVEDLRRRNFDFCFNMSSSAYTSLLLKLLDIPDSRGWISDDEGYRLISSPWTMLFAAFVYHSNRDYNSINLVDIFRCAAGVRNHPRRLVFEPSPGDVQFAKDYLAAKALPGRGPLICVQAGASQTKRQWPPRDFAALAKSLVEELDANLIFTGSAGEKPIIDSILKHYPHPQVISAAGDTTPSQLAGLLQQAEVLVTGDTGPMHLAVAVDTRVVSLFVASALGYETGPYGIGNFVVQPQMNCHPCNPNFPCARTECHAQITPAIVAELVKLRLRVPKTEPITALPAPLAEQSEAAIYMTGFDEDGFLTLSQLNKRAGRHGEPGEYFDAARDAYRNLWKEEFDNLVCRELPVRSDDPEITHPQVGGLLNLIRFAREGASLIFRLHSVVTDPRGSVSELKQLNTAIEANDAYIEEVGLLHPVLGALVRVFLMEKENLRGDDVLDLASKTKELYQRLERRSRRFGHLFGHFYAPPLPEIVHLRGRHLRAAGTAQDAALSHSP